MHAPSRRSRRDAARPYRSANHRSSASWSTQTWVTNGPYTQPHRQVWCRVLPSSRVRSTRSIPSLERMFGGTMNLARIKKAIAAALAAGIAGALASLQAAGHVDSNTIAQAVGAGVAAALVAGIATYAAPKNAEPPAA